MGLDIYVGTLTRYYSGNWETIMERWGKGAGVRVRIVRPGEPPAEKSDPQTVFPAVLQWRADLRAALGPDLASSFDWEEEPEGPYFTDKPGWDCYSDLCLWAAYSENPLMKRPQEHVEDLSADPALEASTSEGAHSRYAHLLTGECWLPRRFHCVLEATDFRGEERNFGSSTVLCEELHDLNCRTWNASQQDLDRWKREGSPDGAPLETGARFSFAVLLHLANLSVQHRLPMLLDW